MAALGSELVDLETDLAALIASKSLGGDWMLGVRVGANINKLRPKLVEFLERENGTVAPALYSMSEAPSGASDETLVLLAEMLDLGFVSALKRPSSPGKVTVFPPVFPPIGYDEPPLSGFGTLLRAAIADNRAKLGDCRPRETARPASTPRNTALGLAMAAFRVRHCVLTA